MKSKKRKTYSLAELKDEFIGKQGTAERDEYDYELNREVLGKTIKANLSQKGQ